MKIKEILTESPLDTFQHHGKTPKTLRNKNIESGLEKVFSKFNLGFGVYTMPTKLNKHGTPTLIDALDFYAVTSKDEALKKLGASVIGNHDVTVIILHLGDITVGDKQARNPDKGTAKSAWGITHDIVHGLEIGEKGDWEGLGEVEKTLNRFAKLFDIEGYQKVYKFYTDICSSKACREDRLNMEEEALTEIVTQYIYTGGIKFRTPPYVDADKFQSESKKVIPQVKQIIDRAISNLKGKVLFTSP